MKGQKRSPIAKGEVRAPQACFGSSSNRDSLGPEEPENFFNIFDKVFQANLAKMTAGVSPAALATAYFSWASQLAQSPGRLTELALDPVFHTSDCFNRILVSCQFYFDQSRFISRNNPFGRQKFNSRYIGPEDWIALATTQEGSWWTAWHHWLVGLSEARRVGPRKLSRSSPLAPGTYVLQK